jgi:hypothetical protein
MRGFSGPEEVEGARVERGGEQERNQRSHPRYPASSHATASHPGMSSVLES